uniref:EMSA1 protein n=1 Tax=Macrostomum lignano TaxID=282301 RepID=A0A1I8ICY8_9PLAT
VPGAENLFLQSYVPGAENLFLQSYVPGAENLFLQSYVPGAENLFLQSFPEQRTSSPLAHLECPPAHGQQLLDRSGLKQFPEYLANA